jgi:hypothetical protein
MVQEAHAEEGAHGQHARVMRPTVNSSRRTSSSLAVSHQARMP